MVLAHLRREVTTALRSLGNVAVIYKGMLIFIGVIVVASCSPIVNECILRQDENHHCVIFLHSETCTVSLLETHCTDLSVISCKETCSWTYSVDIIPTEHQANFDSDEKSLNVTAEELRSKGCNQVMVICRQELDAQLSVHFEVVFLLEGSGGTCPTSTTPVTSIEHSVTDVSSVPLASPTIASSVTTTTHTYATNTITVTETPTHTPTTNDTHEVPGWVIGLVIALVIGLLFFLFLLLCCVWQRVMLFMLGLFESLKRLWVGAGTELEPSSNATGENSRERPEALPHPQPERNCEASVK